MSEWVDVRYTANNSGGEWWLTDDDWRKLELAGWHVDWFATSSTLLGVRDGRFLGALADEASKRFPTLRAAVEEFERITGQNADDEGCNCCGRPHEFVGITSDGKDVYFESRAAAYARSYGDEDPA